MRGIVAWGTYLPLGRLDKSEIAAVAGRGGGRGTRTVASFDEDPTTMAVEASRRAIGATITPVESLLFASVNPAYADRTNATAIHAALRLDVTTPAFDLGLSARSAVGGLLMAAEGTRTTLVAAADIRTGLAGSDSEANGGDAAVAIVIGEHTEDAPVLAEIISSANTTREFIDRWRAPGTPHSKIWDEKFATNCLTPLAQQALQDALEAAGATGQDLKAAAVSASSARVARAIAPKLKVANVVSDFSDRLGHCGAAQPGLLLAHLLESSAPGDLVALCSATDGADALILRVTEAVAQQQQRAETVARLAEGGKLVPYGKFLSWRGLLAVEPPRRPEPQRISATAAARSADWKYGFVGSIDSETGAVHLPPMRVSADGDRTDDMAMLPMAQAQGTIATFTIDRVAYSPSPPIIFAVVDFDGGGRLPVELCDCDETEVHVGARIEMTFRRLHAADDMPNYFWKAKLARG